MDKQKWIAIFGNVNVADGEIIHVPVLGCTSSDDMPAADSAEIIPPHALVRSNMEFDQGTITWEAKIEEQNGRVQLMFPADAAATYASKGDSVNPELAVGLNVLGAPYGFAIWNGTWTDAGGSGHGSILPLGEWIPMKLIVRGSIIELYVYGVKVATTNHTLKRGGISILLQGSTGSAARNFKIIEDLPMCFAIMQFTEEFNILYQDVIRPVCESYGYQVVRGDDYYTSGQIMEDVTQSIRSAALIIADVTPDNANVFYEVGYAHAIGKPTILLCDRRRERLPFDISGFRTLFYDNTIGGKSLVETRLKQHLDALRPK